MKILNNNGEPILSDGLKFKGSENSWDTAHDYVDTLDSKYFVEPDLESGLYKDFTEELKLKSPDNGYIQSWPQPNEDENNLLWHLNEGFSQLRTAKMRW